MSRLRAIGQHSDFCRPWGCDGLVCLRPSHLPAQQLSSLGVRTRSPPFLGSVAFFLSSSDCYRGFLTFRSLFEGQPSTLSGGSGRVLRSGLVAGSGLDADSQDWSYPSYLEVGEGHFSLRRDSVMLKWGKSYVGRDRRGGKESQLFSLIQIKRADWCWVTEAGQAGG